MAISSTAFDEDGYPGTQGRQLSRLVPIVIALSLAALMVLAIFALIAFHVAHHVPAAGGGG